MDPDCIFDLQPYPTVSPDGNWVAYVSKGHICVCNIESQALRKIMEVPRSRTWPHFKVGTGRNTSSGSFEALSRGLNREQYDELRAQLTNTIYGLIWTHDSSGFVFGIEHYDTTRKTSTYDGYLASAHGVITKLGHVYPEMPTRGISVGFLTRDRRYLVSASLQMAHPDHRPLIWDVRNFRPRATGYLYLSPSTTSDRWIGVEKDTQQLVMVDNNFEVIKRFDETISRESFGFKLDWSPDERFIIWRNQTGFDYYSNWEGFWMDLHTGKKRELTGRFMGEEIAFTGLGGEFFRCGADGVKANWSGDQITGAHLTIVPEGDEAPRDLWRIKAEPDPRRPSPIPNLPGSPPLRPGPGCRLFAIGLPRPEGEQRGWIWHLIDRDGNTWKFPGKVSGKWYSPYDVAGFAENGKTIIAYDKTRLFALPVSTIVSASDD
jgi:hypothetical protein